MGKEGLAGALVNTVVSFLVSGDLRRSICDNSGIFLLKNDVVGTH